MRFPLLTAVFLSTILTSAVIIVVPMTKMAYAKQTVSIIPGASDKTRTRSFDITFYPVKTKSKVSWVNDDNMNHRLVITAENGTEEADSGIIKPENSFPHKFNKPGLYHFTSPLYPWMYGDILVTADVSTAIVSHLKNKVDVQLTLSPFSPKVGQMTHFVISFINAKADKNQEHIDYAFAIDNLNGKTVYSTSGHSSEGVEQISYKFDNNTAGNYYIFTVTIYSILFQPVEPDEAKFTIRTTLQQTILKSSIYSAWDEKYRNKTMT